MAGDFSRRTYDPRRDVAGLFEQQGRVRVDADLNELVEVIDRRFRTTSMDVFHAAAGRVVVPAETPDAFAITIAGGSLTIGPGRAYVDGIQADNHGIGVPPPALHFDRGIEEKVGTVPLPFSPQPYLPSHVAAGVPGPTAAGVFGPTRMATPRMVAPSIPRQGTHLAYLDVWHRERTKDENPELLDPALYGIDTATRRQIVWQVKLLQDVGNATCDTPPDRISGWPAASAARLTTTAVGVPAADDPCDIPPVGGYRGVTNRLYRVEIHDGGGFGQATFKWSRNGGSGGTSILAINGAAITVAQLGRDKYARFATGDWVEVLDDIRELEGMPGEMAKVDSVDEARGIVTLTAPLTGPFPSPATNGGRLRKWDQRVGVPPNGVFTSGTASVVLEDGVQIQLSLDPEVSGGEFKSHEYWLFAARAADASVEELNAAPPVGPHHHVGKLAIIDMAAGTVVDCRHPWPPFCDGAGCECDQCVHVGDHNQDGLGIQRAVDAVRGTGGVVCLEAGIYVLHRPVRITRATSITIRGKGWRTIVLTPGDLPAFVVEQSVGVTIEELSVLGVRARDEGVSALVDRQALVGSAALLQLAGGQMAVAFSNSIRLVLQRCVLAVRPSTRTDAPVVALQGIVADLTVRENVMVGSVGIGNVMRGEVTSTLANQDATPTLSDHLDTIGKGYSLDGTSQASLNRQATAARLSRLLLARSRISDNIIGGLVGGIVFGPYTIHAADNEVARNTVVVSLLAGTLHMGVAVLGGTTIRANTVFTGAFGIASGLDGMRVSENDVFGIAARRGATLFDTSGTAITSALAASVASAAVLQLPAAGIMLLDGIGFNRPLEGARINGNRVTGVGGVGVLGASRVAAVGIDHNIVSECSLGGIVMVGRSGGAVSIDGNTVERIGRTTTTVPRTSVADLKLYLSNYRAGIAVLGVLDADVRGNRVESVDAQLRGTVPFGVLLLSCANGLVGFNRVTDIGDETGFAAGIVVIGTFDKADIVDDSVRIGPRSPAGAPRSWTGILVSGFRPVSPAVAAVIAALQVVTAARLIAELVDGRLVRLIPVGRELIAVRGNTVDGGGADPMIRVFSRNHATLSDNRVVVDTQRGAAVTASGRTLIANANYVDVDEKGSAMDLVVSADATVLGNVTPGTIELNNSNIQTASPWNVLNVSSG